MTPLVDGELHHFHYGGLYDGLFVMTDARTGSLWHHITGEAMHGPLSGTTLARTKLLPMNVKLALQVDAEMSLAMSDRPLLMPERYDKESPDPVLEQAIAPTLGQEDARRPRMDIGLGIWTDSTHRYYPMDVIVERGNALVDEIDGRRVLIYIEPESLTPVAVFVDASSVTWSRDEVRLDTGATVTAGVIRAGDGTPREGEQPLQMFTRWYGFALTFPDCEVFGE